MFRQMKNPSSFKRVNLLLMKGADRLTGEDLFRITEVAEQAGAAIYVSLPSWQILLAAPVMQQQEISEKLRERGYDSVKVTRKLDQGSALKLKGKSHEAALQNCRVTAG